LVGSATTGAGLDLVAGAGDLAACFEALGEAAAGLLLVLEVLSPPGLTT